VEIDFIDARIRELCLKATSASEAELEPLFAELQAALRAHSRFVRRMAADTLRRMAENSPSSSNAAD
jgi:hypothetical protein